jgi:hypothetical protein
MKPNSLDMESFIRKHGVLLQPSSKSYTEGGLNG